MKSKLSFLTFLVFHFLHSIKKHAKLERKYYSKNKKLYVKNTKKFLQKIYKIKKDSSILKEYFTKI